MPRVKVNRKRVYKKKPYIRRITGRGDYVVEEKPKRPMRRLGKMGGEYIAGMLPGSEFTKPLFRKIGGYLGSLIGKITGTGDYHTNDIQSIK